MSKPSAIGAAARRLMRPAYELIVNAAHSSNGAPRNQNANILARSLPPGQILDSLRMRQYLSRLSAAWSEAACNKCISIFDQAFVQTISGIVVMRPSMADADIGIMLAAVPRSDLAIRIDTPLNDIEARLDWRHHRMGGIGRIFEYKQFSAIEQEGAAERLDALLQQSERPVICVRAGDDDEFEANLYKAEREISLMHSTLCTERC